jgi:diadenosine tetraphosphatase ApaH/serine/threonine PP2A family protein phosphatase
MGHTCHALQCETKLPPRLHMCKPHWAMVPMGLQRRLWRTYRPGQERDKKPSAAYMRAAADCIEAVAEAEGLPADLIAAEVAMYRDVAKFLEAQR